MQVKVLILNIRNEACGDVIASVTILTSKTKEELESFTNLLFSILINSYKLGYKGNADDPYIVATYVKKQLKLTDNDLVVVKPDTIERFY